MKKIVILLAVTVLLFGFSAQAMASFADGDLVRVVFSTSNQATMYEVGTSLGNVLSLTNPTTTNYAFTGQPTFNFNMLQSGATAANSYVAYFVWTNSAASAWMSGDSTGEKGSKSALSGYKTSAINLDSAFLLASVNQSTANQGIISQADPASFTVAMGQNGRMHSFLATSSPSFTVANLANLDTVGYVDQYLYYYTGLTGSGAVNGLSIAKIRTYADGHTELNPNAVPIPAAVYLFGSGLLGLVGIRRKMTV